MFSKSVDHQDVDSEAVNPGNSCQPSPQSTNENRNLDFSQTGCLPDEFSFSSDEQALSDKYLKAQSAAFKALEAIQKSTALIPAFLPRDEILKVILKLSYDFIPFDSANVIFQNNGDWHPVLEENKSEFMVLFGEMEKAGLVKWLLDKQTYIVVQPEDFEIPEKLNIAAGRIITIPLLMNKLNKSGIAYFHINNDELNFSLSDLETVKVLIDQYALTLQFGEIRNQLSRKEESLQELFTQLIDASKLALGGELAKGITHEINNPLQIILGKLQLAMMTDGKDETLTAIEEQSLRIASLVKEIYHITAEKKQSSREFVEIRPLIDKTINLVQGQLVKRGIEFTVTTTEKIPGVWGNSSFISRIILNIILNSKTRMEKGGHLKINSGLSKDGMIQIDIEDTGEPLADNELNLLQNLFNGNGEENLGKLNLRFLALVLMMKELSGKIEFSNCEPRGIKITIKFPCNDQKELIHERPQAS